MSCLDLRNRSFPLLDFLSGAAIPLLIRQRKIDRPEGYSLSNECLGATVRFAGFEEEGFGEGPWAFDKAYSEALERCALRAYCQFLDISQTSNGWAAHFSQEAAEANAYLELVERHSVLSAWEKSEPFRIVPVDLWPLELLSWSQRNSRRLEFCEVQVLLSSNQYGAAISVLFCKSDGSFVTGHASGIDLKTTILSAARESLRAVHAALRFEFFSNVLELHSGKSMVRVEPGAHSLAYAYGHRVPPSFVTKESNAGEVRKSWDNHVQTVIRALKNQKVEMQSIRAGDRWIAKATSDHLRSIYWGMPGTDSSNQYPHFVG